MNGFCNKEARTEELVPYYFERSPIPSVNIKAFSGNNTLKTLKTLQKASKNVNNLQGNLI